MTELEKRVNEIIEENAENYDNGAEGFVHDVLYGGCQSGIVGELIYYKDTHEWFDTYYEDIMALREELSDMMGEPLNSPVDTDMKNWFAWLSFEETARKLYPEAY